MKLRSVLALALLAACTHGEPFAVVHYGDTAPLPGYPRRLTFSPFSDSEATWLPDGSALLYSAYRPDFAPDSTTCLQFLAPEGGSALRSLCPAGPAQPDSTRAYQAPAVSPGGRLAYLRSARVGPDIGWSVRQLMVGRLDGSVLPRVVLAKPFAGFNGITQLQWLDEHHLVFRADYYSVQFCSGCYPIEADSGLFIATLDLSGDTAVLVRLPGTDSPGSVAVVDSDDIYYTLLGDTHVYQRQLSTGTVTVPWDFSPDYPDAVHVTARRLALLSSGFLTLVSRDSGTVSRVDTAVYDGVALSPDGTRLVGHRHGDLWEFLVP